MAPPTQVCQWYFLLSSSFSTKPQKIATQPWLSRHGLAAGFGWDPCSDSLITLNLFFSPVANGGLQRAKVFLASIIPRRRPLLGGTWMDTVCRGFAESSNGPGDALPCADFLLPQLTGGRVSCGHLRLLHTQTVLKVTCVPSLSLPKWKPHGLSPPHPRP